MLLISEFWPKSIMISDLGPNNYLLSFFRMYVPPVYRRTTFRRSNVSVNKSN